MAGLLRLSIWLKYAFCSFILKVILIYPSHIDIGRNWMEAAKCIPVVPGFFEL
jgi:hypothetical protein